MDVRRVCLTTDLPLSRGGSKKVGTMTDKWFYVKDNTQHGPVAHQDIQKLITNRELGTESFVWSQDYLDWQRAGHIRQWYWYNRVPLQGSREDGGSYEPGHPWPRFFARCFDLNLFAILTAIGFHFFYRIDYRHFTAWRPILIHAGLAVVAPLVLETLCLAIAGTTPGKAILGIRLRRYDGRRIGPLAAVARTLRVFIFGSGLFVPLISLFTLIYQYRTVSKGYSTSWDDALEIDVQHAHMNALRVLMYLVLLAAIPTVAQRLHLLL